MATYLVTQGIQGPEGAQGATGPQGPAGDGSGSAGANEVYSTYVLTTEEIVLEMGGGGTITEGVSISFVDGQDLPEGSRAVVIRTGGQFESYLATGAEWLYENPQLSTFAKGETNLGGQSALLNVYMDTTTGDEVVNTIYAMLGDELAPLVTSTAYNVSYDADEDDWTGTAPTTLKEAIDRIAAAIGPIA